LRLSGPEHVCIFGTEPCFFLISSTRIRLLANRTASPSVSRPVQSVNRFSCLVKGTPRPLFDEPKPGVVVSARTEAELAQKEDLVGQSLAGSSTGGTDAGIESPRPRAGLMSSGDSRPRPRGGRPGLLLEPDSWRRPWRRWPGRGADVVLRGGDPPTASPSEARSDLSEGVVNAEGAAAPFNCQDPSLQGRIILQCVYVFCGRRGPNTPSSCCKAAFLFILFRVSGLFCR
jgi:hypothetical protein